MNQSTPIKLSCIIDDDDVYVNLIKKVIHLKKLSENLLIFKNGQEALDYFETLEELSFPEIILLDLNMPVMNGWGFLKAFSKIQPFKKFNTSLYIVSSSINKVEVEKAKTYEIVTDYLLKPVNISQLEALFNTNMPTNRNR